MAHSKIKRKLITGGIDDLSRKLRRDGAWILVDNDRLPLEPDDLHLDLKEFMGF
jgi:hypothetical protein